MSTPEDGPAPRPAAPVDATLAPPAMSERRTSLVGAMLVAVGPISMALYTPAMPTLAAAFGTPESAIKLTLSVYFAGFAVTQLICGPLSDALGRRPVTLAFMGLYLAASLIAVFATGIEWLLAARLLQGVGASVGVSTSRAIVRDQFSGERSARIMNTIGIILAIGPALAPTIGGLTLGLAGWHALFVAMFGFGVLVIGVTFLFMRETVVPDRARLAPRALFSSYRRLLSSPLFLATSVTLAGAVGALYTLATVLPFVLIARAGLTPTQFGIGMLGQSGLFFLGSLVVRWALGRGRSAYRLVPLGLAFMGAGSLLLVLSIALLPVSYPGIMVPVGLYAFGIAFVMPAMTTASLAPFPEIAGAAAAVMGFIQMGAGLLGGALAALIGEPVVATQVVIPALGLISILAYQVYRRQRRPRPEPAEETPAPPFVPD